MGLIELNPKGLLEAVLEGVLGVADDAVGDCISETAVARLFTWLINVLMLFSISSIRFSEVDGASRDSKLVCWPSCVLPSSESSGDSMLLRWSSQAAAECWRLVFRLLTCY